MATVVAPGSIAARFALPENGLSTAADAKRDFGRLVLNLLAIAAVLGSLTFNFFLAFVNTRVFSVSEALVMLGELALLGLAFLVAADRRGGLYVFLGVFCSYMFTLFVLRHAIDPKPVRDVLIPAIFIFAGSRLASIKLADGLVLASVIIVLIVGAAEYLILDTYLDFINVLGYYITKGSLSVEDTFGQTRGLFASGIRPEPRTILPFLGQQRVSSVFLEPVSAGNFGAIAYAWALYSTKMRWRFVVMACALGVVALADARFGFLTCILMTVLYPFYNLIARPVWLFLPFLALAFLAVYGIVTGATGGDNGFAGRFEVTAALLTQLPLDVVLGVTATDVFVADSGLAYSLTQFGLFGFVGLWAVLVFLPTKSARAWKFHSMVMIYFLLLLMISNSGYSIKTAALLWFLLGTALGERASEAEEPQRPAQARSSRPDPRRAFS